MWQRSSPMAQQTSERVSRSWTTRRDEKRRRMQVIQPRSKERTKEYEIQFLTEANLTPRNVARFCHAGRQRLSGPPPSRDAAPRLRSGLRATSAFAGRAARKHARQVQRRSHGNAKAG